MSGGALDYAFSRIEDIANQVDMGAQTPLHKAFAAHLRLVAKAAHDLEWVLSCDYAPGDEVAAIRACVSGSEELSQAILNANGAREELERAIERANGLKKDAQEVQHALQHP